MRRSGEQRGGRELPRARRDERRPAVIWRAFAWVVAGPLCFLIPIAWVVAAVLAVQYLPSISSSEGSLGDLTPSDAAAIQAEKRAAELFSLPVLSRVAVVQRDPGGLPQPVLHQTLDSAVALDKGQTTPPRGLRGAFPIANVGGAFEKAGEQGTTAITYLFFDPSLTWEEQVAGAQAYARSSLNAPGSSVVGVTGSLPGRLAQSQHILDRLTWVEVATIALIALIVGVTFRSVVAPAVTLFAGAISYMVAQRVVAWAGVETGYVAPAELEPLIVVLLLGIVTDYAIFYLSGMRHRLLEGWTRTRAARATTAQYTPIILTAGLMVAGGTFALIVAAQQFFRAFGPGMALTVLVGVAVAVTLVPAMLALLGRAAYWPRVPRAEPASAALHKPAAPPAPSLRTRVAHLSTSRPFAFAIATLCILALLLAANGLRDTRLGLDLIAGLPSSDPVKEAATAASEGFTPGILSPTETVVEQEGIGDRQDALVALQEEMAQRPGVSAVIGPREQVTATAAGVASGVDAAGTPAAISEDGNAARYLVVFDADPLGAPGMDRYTDLRQAMPSLLDRAGLGGASVLYAGDTALAQDTVERTLGDLGRIAIAVLLVDLLLLIVFLRGLVAPLYLLGASVLALGASLGLTTYVFQKLLGGYNLTYYVPFAASVLLVALGSDYTIFLVGRIWEEAKMRPMRDAIETAVPRARNAISVAAIALAFSFALLALVDLTSFRELAFLLFAGVLIDAFFVRSLLVPALVALFARREPLDETAEPVLEDATAQRRSRPVA